MFVGCVLSFALGYAIGAFRVSRYVCKELDAIRGSMTQIEKHGQELRQFYSKLGDADETEDRKA